MVELNSVRESNPYLKAVLGNPEELLIQEVIGSEDVVLVLTDNGGIEGSIKLNDGTFEISTKSKDSGFLDDLAYLAQSLTMIVFDDFKETPHINARKYINYKGRKVIGRDNLAIITLNKYNHIELFRVDEALAYYETPYTDELKGCAMEILDGRYYKLSETIFLDVERNFILDLTYGTRGNLYLKSRDVLDEGPDLLTHEGFKAIEEIHSEVWKKSTGFYESQALIINDLCEKLNNVNIFELAKLMKQPGFKFADGMLLVRAINVFGLMELSELTSSVAITAPPEKVKDAVEKALIDKPKTVDDFDQALFSAFLKQYETI